MPRDAEPWPVVELRRYRLRPGRRDALIELFDRELVEPQEAVGLHVLGQFRDLDHPDTFVWLRGFRQRSERADALAAFYQGPVWAQHKDAANATMVDSDDVLLLRPLDPDDGLGVDRAARPGFGEPSGSPGLVTVGQWPVKPSSADAVAERFEQDVRPRLERAGAQVAAAYRSEHAANDYPALPVREGEEVLVWIGRFDDEEAHRAFSETLARDTEWLIVKRDLERHLDGATLELRLVPTGRSALVGRR